jgi:hypothetical protein
MPYIDKRARSFLDQSVCHSISAGELNYQFTMLARTYLHNHGTTYATINDIIGAFESAKMEFYRRVVIPYEEKKIKENGDVYPEVK